MCWIRQENELTDQNILPGRIAGSNLQRSGEECAKLESYRAEVCTDAGTACSRSYCANCSSKAPRPISLSMPSLLRPQTTTEYLPGLRESAGTAILAIPST